MIQVATNAKKCDGCGTPNSMTFYRVTLGMLGILSFVLCPTCLMLLSSDCKKHSESFNGF